MRRRPTAAACTALVLALAPGVAAAAPLAVPATAGVRRAPAGAWGASYGDAVHVAAPAAFTVPVEVPAGARLLTAVAVAPLPAVDVAAVAPLRFRIVFEEETGATTLYERTIDLAREADRRWFDVGRDLAEFGGRRGTLRFETTVAPPAGSRAAPLPGVAGDVPDPTPAAGRSPTPPADTGRVGALWAPPELAVCAGEGPSVLLVTIDALRADHLSGAGYARATTPHLDAFATGATRFSAAFTGAPKTIPSIPQTLTGSWFYQHRGTVGLAPLLGARGFARSRAIVNNPYVATWLGTQRPGFASLVAGELDARAITSAALRHLTALGPCRSALYLHYLDPHTPYRPPPRWARRFVDPASTTTIGLTFDDVTGAWQGRYGPADRARIVALYDGAIAYTDRQLGRLVRGLARRHRLDHTIVIVTADHGEEFWDHGKFFHGQSLYDELLHVPLLMRLPDGGHGRTVPAVVSTVDVLPTVLEAAGLPEVASDGTSLVGLARGQAGAAASRAIFATVSHAEPRTPERQAVRTATHKLVRNVDDGLLEVYDLIADPGERRNLGAGAPAARELLAALDAVRGRLADVGDQLRLRSRSAQPVRYVVTIAGTPPVPIISPDRLTLEREDSLAIGPRSARLVVRGTLAPGEEDRVRMDVLADRGTLAIGILLDGKPAPAGTLRLGPAGRAGGPEVELADPALVGAPGAGEPADAPAVTVAFWRVPAEDGAAIPPPLDDDTRERLRQLGYVE